ncbi:MAG: hypothetical protein LKF96_11095 [Treponema sp.]|jgi:hypothetical protein|nr:hypothetical protein [Treponema sp.]
MVGLFIRKNFYDGWDNMGSLVIPNLMVLLLGTGSYWLVSKISEFNIALSMVVLVLCIAVCSIPVFAYSESAAEIADFSVARISDFFGSLRGVVKDAVLFGLLAGSLAVVAFVGLPYYFSIGNLFGFTLGMILFWFEVLCLLALQWFLPVRALMHNDFKKCLKKSFIIFFDNPGFSFFMFLYNTVLAVLSVILFFILPSVSGITLALVNALRLRLYKYDWLEAHPELTTRAEQKKVPWDELLADDDEMVGHRTFKSFIFPWKE